jgi:flagellar biogenesis protein FliO
LLAMRFNQNGETQRFGSFSVPSSAARFQPITMAEKSGKLMTILIIILGVLYFIPTLVAVLRGHHNSVAIIALNILLGWTFLGWIASFVWSLTAKRLAT